MSFFQEYALLFAVALPVVTIVGLQVFLLASGERGTALLPGLGAYPSIESGAKTEEVAMTPIAMPAASAKQIVSEPSNDEMEREAA